MTARRSRTGHRQGHPPAHAEDRAGPCRHRPGTPSRRPPCGKAAAATSLWPSKIGTGRAVIARCLSFFCCELGGEQLRRRLGIDQGIGVEVRRNDVRPFVQDAVQIVVALDVEHRNSAATDPRIDMPADILLTICFNPRPERLPRGGDLGSAVPAAAWKSPERACCDP